MIRREIAATALAAALGLACGALSAQTDGHGQDAHGTDGDQAGDQAGDRDGLARMLEVRAHQALLDRIGRADAELAPFVTDGCSGGLSETWRLVSAQFPDFAAAHQDVPPWETCCVVHDAAYHDGAGAATAQAGYAARMRADEALRQCVLETGESRKRQVAAHYDIDADNVTAAYAVIADAMYLAVRFGGAPCSGLSWRWGFGWPDCAILSAAPAP